MPRSSGHFFVKCFTTMMSRSSQATFLSVSRFLSSDSYHPGIKILSAAQVIEALKAENRTTNGILDLERLLDIDVDQKTLPKDGETLSIALDQIPKPPVDVRSAEKFFVDEAVEKAKSDLESGLESGLGVGTGSISLPAIRRKAGQDYQLLPEAMKILYQKKHVEDMERFNREKSEWEKIMDIKITIRQMLQLIANNKVLARKLATANVSKVASTSSPKVGVPRLGLKMSGKSEAMKVKFDSLVSEIKRPMSGIECFIHQENERRGRNGEIGLSEEEGVKEYRNLSEIDKLMYDAMATLEKNRYKREVDEVRKRLKEGVTD